MSESVPLILIIDDSPSDRRIYRRYLENRRDFPVRILEAASGEDGLRECAANRPDCILLDFRLPDRDGTDLIEPLRKISRAPILLITGNPEASTQINGYRLGVQAFLSKDFISSESLLAAVRTALGTRPAEPSG